MDDPRLPRMVSSGRNTCQPLSRLCVNPYAAPDNLGQLISNLRRAAAGEEGFDVPWLLGRAADVIERRCCDTTAEVDPPSWRYFLENRYQDSRWTPIDGLEYSNPDAAEAFARRLSRNAIANGMVRVVDRHTGRVVATYSAGGGNRG